MSFKSIQISLILIVVLICVFDVYIKFILIYYFLLIRYHRSDGRITHGVYNGVDYFYGGTAICYKDLWIKSTSYTYNDDFQLPKSFSHLPFLPNLEDNNLQDNHVDLNENGAVPIFNVTLNSGRKYFLLK